MKKSMACAALTMAMAGGALAQGVQVRGIVGGGLTFGGDTLATLNYEDNDVDDAKVHAGGLIAVNAGVEVQFTPMVSAQALIGYHFDRANASNGNVRFERTPFELLGHFRVNDWFRLGGGARYTSGAKFRSSGFSELRNVDFKPTWGTVVEGEFFPTQSFGIKLRYVAEKFKAKNVSNAQTIDGNHGGVYFNFYF